MYTLAKQKMKRKKKIIIGKSSKTETYCVSFVSLTNRTRKTLSFAMDSLGIVNPLSLSANKLRNENLPFTSATV